ncbi:MAG: hypothetical protein E7661_03040 [Ruminococcaceae bacterium]|nr:hypothetical protein [Oscillospiraceae bacterium]
MAFNPRNKKKSNGKGCLFLVIGSIVGVLLLGVFIVLTGQLTSMIINSTMAGTVGYVMLTATEPCIMVASLLLFAVLVIHYLPDPEDMDKGKKPLTPDAQVPKRKKFLGAKLSTWLATLGLVLCVVLTAFVSATTYRAVTTEGVRTTVCQFITTDEYQWKQVSSYKVDCDEEKGLSVTLTMRNGKQFEILQSAVSAPRSFHEAYDCKEAFVLDLVTMLEEEYQVTRNVSHLERTKAFYKDDAERWTYVKELIGYEEIVYDEPADTDAETAGVTEAVTEVSGSENP